MNVFQTILTVRTFGVRVASQVCDLPRRRVLFRPVAERRRFRAARYATAAELLEDRTMPAAASLVGGVLKIDFTAAGTTAEDLALANDGNDVFVSGDVTDGPLRFTTADVDRIEVLDSGGSSAQSLAFRANKEFDLSAGLSITDVEMVVLEEDVTTVGGELLIDGAVVRGRHVTLTSTGGGNIKFRPSTAPGR